MARLLFEEQGIRTRRGSLATGIEFVVYTDAAGTVLADISATVGASATSTATVVAATSTVAAADITGLGLSALQFYGPDGVDTLYLRCPADLTLGVQEIEADTDERLDAVEAAGGGGAHPDLATHDTLGLATDAELTAHAAAADPHTGYALESDHTLATHDALGLATDAELTAHAAAGDPHPGYALESDHTLAAHDTLGLATDTELSAHAGAANPHPVYATDADLSAHEADTTGIHGIADTSVLATDADLATHAGASDPHGDRAYADAVAQGLDPKASVRVKTTANLTLSGEQTIDGVLTSASRVLVANQSAAEENGIYVSAAGAWSRATDADTSGEVTTGLYTFVEEGTTQASSGWVLTTPAPITLGTTALAFTQFSQTGQILGGAGLVKTGNVLDVVAGTGLTVAADTVGIIPGGVSATELAASAVTNAKVDPAAAIAEPKLALNFPTHAQDHAARHAAAGADPLTGYATSADLSAHAAAADPHAGYVQESAHTLAAHDTLGLATDAELATHEAAADPHAGYALEADHTLASHDAMGLATDAELGTHEAATDPHQGYVLESAHTLAAHDTLGLATDTEVTSAVSTHAGLADPHAGYVLESLADAKGDLVAATAADTVARLAVGADGAELSPDSSTATGLKWLGPAVLNVKAAPYNAVGNDTADDTAALQAAITEAVTNAKIVYLPPGTYKITSKLNFPMRPNWSVVGASRGTVTIKQYTANTPIFDLGTDAASSMHTWEISGIVFDYAVSQPSTNTNANAIRFSQMAYQGKLTQCTFARGSWALKVAAGIGCPWGTTFDDLWFDGSQTGGAMDWSTGINAVPNNRFGRILVSCQSMVGPVFSLRGYNFVIDTIEFLAANQGPALFLLASGGQVDIGTMKLENGVYTTSGRSLFEFQTGCQARIGHMSIGGNAMTINTGTFVNLLSHGTGGGGGYLKVDFLKAALSATAVGGAYLVNTAGPVELGQVVMANGWQLQNNGSTTSGDWITVRDHGNGRLSANKGNADYTIALGDPSIVNFTTAFTAARNINLPSTGQDLHNGLTYRFVMNGAVNGANTAVFKCGATTLRTETADKRVISFTYRRNPTVASGWIMTGYETLP